MTFGVVVAGAGFVAQHHIAALNRSSRARLAGIVDTDLATARRTAFANGGVPATSELEEALGWPDVHGLIVCTPNATHTAIAREIAAAGKHLLIEKPLATTKSEAREIAKAFQDLTLTVAHTHRAYDYARAVKSTLDSGAIGDPTLIRLSILGGWLWGDWSAWVLDPAQSGGHMMHNGVHLLDLVTWWMGDLPTSVYARGRAHTSAELRIDDHLEMVLRFPGNRAAHCEMSRAHRPGSLAQRDVLVVGTEGTLQLPWDGDSGLLITETGTSALPADTTDAFQRQLDGWLDAVEGGTALADGEDGVRAVALAEAAQRSIDSGRPEVITW